ncbi:MAG: hypothetical protein IIY43_01955 [Oscillospiraceae bacterium]|nr:hypothetical protein [Oscillospiraceae bacterium]
MAKVSFVPYDSTYAALFEYCQVSIPTQDFGGQEGWDATAFASAVNAARTYLDEHYPEDETEAAAFEDYYNMLDNYTVVYWSLENYQQQ